MIRVEGHNVKYSNRNNSPMDCSISLKFRTDFDRGEAGLLHMFEVKGQSSTSRGQVQGHSVTYRNVSAVKRSKTATLPQVAMYSQLPPFLVLAIWSYDHKTE